MQGLLVPIEKPRNMGSSKQLRDINADQATFARAEAILAGALT